MHLRSFFVAALVAVVAACSSAPPPDDAAPVPLTEAQFRELVVGNLLNNPGDALSDTRIYNNDGSLRWTGEKIVNGRGTWNYSGNVLVTHFVNRTGRTATVCEYVFQIAGGFDFQRTACP